MTTHRVARRGNYSQGAIDMATWVEQMELVVDGPWGGAGVHGRDHVVQFYRRREELAERAGGYLASAVRDGAVAVAIATPEHRLAIEQRMAAAGIDVPAAAARGGYLTLDAAETLSRVAPGRKPDRARFELVMGGLVYRAVSAGRPVRAYGELVALLWGAGLVTGAIELEELWHGLGRRYPFGLWCGYPAEQMADDHLTGAVTSVCCLHDVVIGDIRADALPGPGAGREMRRRFAASLDAPGQARRFVTAALEACGAGDLADDAALVVTELAANAVVHARSDFMVTLTAAADALRISVRDAAPLPAGGRAPALPAAPGHGLGAVAALASRWGAGPAGSGKVVWAELSRLPAAVCCRAAARYATKKHHPERARGDSRTNDGGRRREDLLVFWLPPRRRASRLST